MLKNLNYQLFSIFEWFWFNYWVFESKAQTLPCKSIILLIYVYLWLFWHLFKIDMDYFNKSTIFRIQKHRLCPRGIEFWPHFSHEIQCKIENYNFITFYKFVIDFGTFFAQNLNLDFCLNLRRKKKHTFFLSKHSVNDVEIRPGFWPLFGPNFGIYETRLLLKNKGDRKNFDDLLDVDFYVRRGKRVGFLTRIK